MSDQQTLDTTPVIHPDAKASAEEARRAKEADQLDPLDSPDGIPVQLAEIAKESKPVGLRLRTLEEYQRFAGLVTAAGVGRKQQKGEDGRKRPPTEEERKELIAVGVTKMVYGAEIGIDPMCSLESVSIVDGRPCLGSGLIAARIKSSKKYDYEILDESEKLCSIQFYRLEGGKRIPLSKPSVFTEEKARNAKLLGKRNWQQYPEAMLFARALTQGARKHCADVFGRHVYTAEELGSDQ